MIFIFILNQITSCRSENEPITIESCSDDETEVKTETKKKFVKDKKKPKEKFQKKNVIIAAPKEKKNVIKVAPKSYAIIKKSTPGKSSKSSKQN